MSSAEQFVAIRSSSVSGYPLVLNTVWYLSTPRTRTRASARTTLRFVTAGGIAPGTREFDDPAGEVAIPGGADVADPYPGFAEARITTPVINVGRTEISGGGDTFFSVRYADVERVLRDE